MSPRDPFPDVLGDPSVFQSTFYFHTLHSLHVSLSQNIHDVLLSPKLLHLRKEFLVVNGSNSYSVSQLVKARKAYTYFPLRTHVRSFLGTRQIAWPLKMTTRTAR